MMRAYWDGVATEYDKLYVGWKEQAEDRLVRKWVDGAWAPGKRTLDIGSGTGWLLDQQPRYATLGRYLGVDISERMVEEAREKHPKAEFRVGDMEDLSFLPTASWDLVVCLYTWNYCKDAVQALAEMRRVLRPGGRLKMTVLASLSAMRDCKGCGVETLPCPCWGSIRLRRALASWNKVELRGMSGLLVSAARLPVLELESRLFGRVATDYFQYILVDAIRR